MKFILASHNKGKLAEMQKILGELGVEVVLQSDLGLDLEPEEDGATFTENARIKARAVMEASGLPAIADDSGLCVDALNGAPGVYSARYGGLDDGPLPPAAAEHAGLHDPGGPLPHLGGVPIPRRHRADGGGRMPGHHCLRPYGRRRLRL